MNDGNARWLPDSKPISLGKNGQGMDSFLKFQRSLTKRKYLQQNQHNWKSWELIETNMLILKAPEL